MTATSEPTLEPDPRRLVAVGSRTQRETVGAAADMSHSVGRGCTRRQRPALLPLVRRRLVLLLCGLSAALPSLANDAPALSIHIGGNASFAWEGEPIRYIVVASDTEDGDSLSGSLDPYSVAVEFRYLADGFMGFAPAPADAGAVIGATRGRALVEGDDCLLCHSERADGPTAIPTYAAIAEKFQGNLSVAPALAYNVLNGSQGIWGTMLMPAHSATMDEATAMALYVLSFANETPGRGFLPIIGSVTPDSHEHVEAGPLGPTLAGRYVLSAAYTDHGNGAEAPVTGTATQVLRSPNVLATELDELIGFEATQSDGTTLLVAAGGGASARLADVDLTGIRNISLVTFGSARRWPGAKIELRMDGVDGALVGAVDAGHAGRRPDFRRSAARIEVRRGRHDVYLVVNDPGAVAIGAICFECSY